MTPIPRLPPRLAYDQLARLFWSSEASLASFADDQIAQEPWFTASGSTGLAPAECVNDPSPPEAVRAGVVRTGVGPFATTMTLRAPRNEMLASVGSNWWDALPLPSKDEPGECGLVVAAGLESMGHILHLPSDRCRPSALQASPSGHAGFPIRRERQRPATSQAPPEAPRRSGGQARTSARSVSDRIASRATSIAGTFNY